MESKNIRKNPFGHPIEEKQTGPTKNVPGKVVKEPPQTVNEPYSGSTVSNPPKVVKQTPNYGTKEINDNTKSTKEDEMIMKEYESLKVFNSPKGFIRTTSDKYNIC